MIKQFLMKHAGKILMCSIIGAIPFILMATLGKTALLIYLAILIISYLALVAYRIHPVEGRTWFYNFKGDKFEPLDIVYDRGSATRPAEPGVLKMDSEGWFILYSDGFEWPMSEPKNIEMFIYQSRNN